MLFKTHLIPDWKGIESLKGKRGVWYRGYTWPDDVTPYLQGREVSRREQAVLVVANEHGAEYYFDNEDQLRQTIQKAEVDIDMTIYRIEPVYVTTLYWRFQDSERGRQLRELFDHGLERLYCSGELESIYTRWQQAFPTYQITCP